MQKYLPIHGCVRAGVCACVRVAPLQQLRPSEINIPFPKATSKKKKLLTNTIGALLEFHLLLLYLTGHDSTDFQKSCHFQEND